MAAFDIPQTIDLGYSAKPEIKHAYGHLGDKLAHEWKVTVIRNGAAVDLSGYSAMALVDNGSGTVEVPATITGNVASALFPAECYAAIGTHNAFMRITNGGATAETIVAPLHFSVDEGESSPIIAPGTDITTTLSGLLASEAARVAAEEDRVDAEAAREPRLAALEAGQLTATAPYAYIRARKLISPKINDSLTAVYAGVDVGSRATGLMCKFVWESGSALVRVCCAYAGIMVRNFRTYDEAACLTTLETK